jgi:hypothetical protein
MGDEKMRLGSLMIGLLFFSAIVIGVGGFYSEIGESYGVGTSNLAGHNQSAYAQSVSTNTLKELNSTTGLGQFTITSFGLFVFSSFYTIMGSFITSITAFLSAILSITTLTGFVVPSWAIGLLVTGATLSIVFLIINTVWSKQL